jgi:CBS domain-containing protein
MFCPSCGHENIEGADRCDECMTSLSKEGGHDAEGSQGWARSVMEDNLSQLEHEATVTVPPDTPALEVTRRIRDAGSGCALIVDGGKLAGIFTEHDVLNKLTGDNAWPTSIAVKELMSPNPEALRDTDSVAVALNKMSLGRYRHIPIAKGDGTFSVTSIKNVLKYIAKEDW